MYLYSIGDNICNSKIKLGLVSLAAAGVVGSAVKFITKNAIYSINWMRPNTLDESKLSNRTAQTIAVISAMVIFGCGSLLKGMWFMDLEENVFGK